MKTSEHPRAHVLLTPSPEKAERRTAVAVMRPATKQGTPKADGRSGGAFFRQGTSGDPASVSADN